MPYLWYFIIYIIQYEKYWLLKNAKTLSKSLIKLEKGLAVLGMFYFLSMLHYSSKTSKKQSKLYHTKPYDNHMIRTIQMITTIMQSSDLLVKRSSWGEKKNTVKMMLRVPSQNSAQWYWGSKKRQKHYSPPAEGKMPRKGCCPSQKWGEKRGGKNEGVEGNKKVEIACCPALPRPVKLAPKGR